MLSSRLLKQSSVIVKKCAILRNILQRESPALCQGRRRRMSPSRHLSKSNARRRRQSIGYDSWTKNHYNLSTPHCQHRGGSLREYLRRCYSGLLHHQLYGRVRRIYRWHHLQWERKVKVVKCHLLLQALRHHRHRNHLICLT